MQLICDTVQVLPLDCNFWCGDITVVRRDPVLSVSSLNVDGFMHPFDVLHSKSIHLSCARTFCADDCINFDGEVFLVHVELLGVNW